MSFGSAEEPRHNRPGARRRRGRRRLRLLLSLLVLFLISLGVGALFLWRPGDSVSGTRVVEDSIDSGPEPRIRLINGRGAVSVEGVAGLRSVEFAATKYARGRDRDAASRNAAEVPIDVSREESSFVIETRAGRNAGADYALRVPTESSLEIEVGAGDVRVRGLEGDVAVRAEAGDVTVADGRGSVTAEVAAGDVALSDIRTETGQAELTVGTGDVTLENLVLGSIEARVETGDVTLSDRFSGGGRISTRTGNITSRLPQEDVRELTLEARVGEVVRKAPAAEGE
ncbi:MAG: DUF4097 domain-containing protein [Actinomycetota bacterium]|nr:DUF4097 domain-containing protein [Actinomycetota bacterium]